VPEIRTLPPSVINKIAAGEVIERPASVVKELVENSVDAGSTRIEVAIEKGGQELIRIADNGCGIQQDQLPLAIASHATSKIQSADDLFKVSSLGFRGEALASISEVSHFILRSRIASENAGYEIEVHGGDPKPVVPCGCPTGTSIEVRHLFFNTPVRRKFLKTPQTEMGHIGEAFTRIALAQPHIHFTLLHNGRVVHELPPTESWAERIGHFFGPEIRDSLIPVQAEDRDLRLWGFVVDPAHSRSHNRMQYLFLNGRHIKDRSLQHALDEAYRGLMMTGRFPIAFLKLEMPVDWVDVNVHPAKLEVRFQDGGRLYSQILGTIRNKFLTTDLTAKAQLTRPSDPTTSLAPERDFPRSPAERQTTLDWRSVPERRDFPSLPAVSGGDKLGSVEASGHETRRQSPFEDLPWVPTSSEGQAGIKEMPQYETVAHSVSGPVSSETSLGVEAAAGKRSRAVQIHNRYLVTENDEGMIVIDQHALHERVLYEQIRSQAVEGELETQQLLVPETVHLSPAEAALAEEHQDVLAQIGLKIEPFGGSTLLIHTYPAMMAKRPPAELLRIALEQLVQGGKTPEKRDILDELLHMMSCKAAIKAGDRLSPEEIDSLIEYRDLCQDAHHCPHGRPTALYFSRDELDRRFKRI
jgi:DNA mismatch repair protein MutL